MALFVLIGVLRGFPAAAYRRTPHRKPLCGLDQNKNCSFMDWTPKVFILNSRIHTIYEVAFIPEHYWRSDQTRRNKSGGGKVAPFISKRDL